MIGRVRSRREFAEFTRSSRAARTAVLWCKYVIDPTATPPLRVAFAVGRSYGRAVDRNRLRRRLRALLPTVADELGVHSGRLLIGAKPAAKERTFEELRTQLTTLLTEVAAT